METPYLEYSHIYKQQNDKAVKETHFFSVKHANLIFRIILKQNVDMKNEKESKKKKKHILQWNTFGSTFCQHPKFSITADLQFLQTK